MAKKSTASGGTKKSVKKAAKKTTKKAAAKTAKVAAGAGGTTLELPGSPCTSRGGELTGVVRVRQGDPLKLFFQVCASPAQLSVSIHNAATPGSTGSFIFGPQEIPPPNPVELPLVLDPGRYIIQWGYIVVDNWQVVAEVQVGGGAMFRKVNTHKDGMPFNTIFAAVEVLP